MNGDNAHIATASEIILVFTSETSCSWAHTPSGAHRRLGYYQIWRSRLPPTRRPSAASSSPRHHPLPVRICSICSLRRNLPSSANPFDANSRRRCDLQAHKKKTPAPEGPGSVVGWVRGWGLGGTPPDVSCPTPVRRGGSCPTGLFSRRGPAGGTQPARARPFRQIERQFDVPAVRELQISQMDVEAPFAAAAAFDHVAGTNREPAGQTICLRTRSLPSHDNSPGAPLPRH